MMVLKVDSEKRIAKNYEQFIKSLNRRCVIKTKKKPILVTITIVLLVAIFVIGWIYVPYLIVDHQYNLLIDKNIRTRADVEKSLFLFDSRQISIEESLWGNTHLLKPGEYCQQYLILNQPIDIVYNHNDDVVAIYSSYE